MWYAYTGRASVTNDAPALAHSNHIHAHHLSLHPSFVALYCTTFSHFRPLRLDGPEHCINIAIPSLSHSSSSSLPIHLHVRSTDFASVFWLDLSNPAICTCNLGCSNAKIPFSDSTPPKRASLVAPFSSAFLFLPSSAILLAFQLAWTFSAPMSSQHGALVRSRVYGHRRIV